MNRGTQQNVTQQNVTQQNVIEQNTIEQSSNITKKKKKRKKKNKSYVSKILSSKQNHPIPIIALALISAFILDTLRVIKNFVVIVLIITLIAGVIGGATIFTWIKPYYDEYKQFATRVVGESTADTFRQMEVTYIYDSDNKVLAKLRGDKDSTYIEYDNIPEYVINAFIAVEDRSFWDNPGIDVKGLVRVGLDAVKTKGEEVHGASTITQQLARNMFLTHEVSLERKGKEMLIALQLTKQYSKRDIMEFYVNNICYANAFYGIEAAANGYFNKTINELSLSEMVYLCAIPNSPTYYDPYKYPERALDRRDKILGDMVELGYITELEYNVALKQDIEIQKPTYEFSNYQTTYAKHCAIEYLMKINEFEFKYDYIDNADYNNYKKDYNEAYEKAEQQLATGGYKVYTSLDTDKQRNLQNILNDSLAFDEELDENTGIYKLQGAITCIDNNSGKVIAVIGGRSQDTNNVYSLNRAYQSYRQPGSSIKPLVVYTPSLIDGLTPNSIVENIDVSKAKEKGVDVQSLRGTTMTLRNALEQSKNGVAWKLFDKIGANKALSYVCEMQFSNICPDDYYNSASLGGLTHGVTTVEMASAYSTLENHGYYRNPSCITKIIDKDGNDIYREDSEKSVYNPLAADTMTDMMTGVLTKGTAAKLNWYTSTDLIAACKTGTTNDSKDGWLCGFTPYYTIAVWVGYDQPRTLNNLYGATYPGQIWKDSMLKMTENEPEIEYFEKSNEYDETEISFEQSGLLPSHAYEMYLPGRSDDEVLSDGYTVFDYRSDRVIGEQAQVIFNQMMNLNKADPNYRTTLNGLYNQANVLIKTIYSTKYEAEMTGQLNSVLNSCL